MENSKGSAPAIPANFLLPFIVVTFLFALWGLNPSSKGDEAVEDP